MYMYHYRSKISDNTSKMRHEMNGRARNRVMGFLATRSCFASYLWHWCFFRVREKKKKKSRLIWEKQNCKNRCYSGKEGGNVEKPEEGTVFCISGLTRGWKCWKYHRWAQAVPAFSEICCYLRDWDHRRFWKRTQIIIK